MRRQVTYAEYGRMVETLDGQTMSLWDVDICWLHEAPKGPFLRSDRRQAARSRTVVIPAAQFLARDGREIAEHFATPDAPAFYWQANFGREETGQ